MRVLLMASALTLAIPTFSAQAEDKLPFMTLVAGPASRPLGWDEFCRNYSAECAPGKGNGFVALTEEKLRELRLVNSSVNTRLVPLINRSGMDYPKDGAANCVGYARQKRLDLIAKGWPADALLFTIVVTLFEEPSEHMVLTVRTDKGEFILDNFTHRGAVVLWSKTRYRFVSRQAGTREGWVKINDPHPLLRLKTTVVFR